MNWLKTRWLETSWFSGYRVDTRDRDKVHAVSDLFVCCIMTHGDQNGLYLSDYNPRRRLGEQVRVERLLECFDARNCPALQHKPKLFFIQVVDKFTERELSMTNG